MVALPWPAGFRSIWGLTRLRLKFMRMHNRGITMEYKGRIRMRVVPLKDLDVGGMVTIQVQ